MKKEIKYYEYYCDRCGEKVPRLYGAEANHYLLKLNNIEQAQSEECKITPAYYLRQNSGRNVGFSTSGICLSCFKKILQYAINVIESELSLDKKEKKICQN